MEKPSTLKESKSIFPKIILTTIVLVSCAGILFVIGLSGFGQKYICETVVPGSFLYEQIQCEKVTQTQQENEGGSIQESKLFEQVSGDEGERVATIVDEIAGGVVGIGVAGDNFNTDSIIGTGFLVSSEGVIVTNRHVVEEAMDYFISFKDQEQTVQIDQDAIFLDPVNDIALIKIDADKIPSTAKILRIGDSNEIKLGQTVIAIGNPLGKYTGSITKGIISGLNREVEISQGFFQTQKEIYEDVIQTDAAINPGNSGGPLLNMKAEVIGINFATVDGASNLSFAIPINRIKARLNELLEFGKFKIPYLGVEFRTRLVYFKGQSIIGAEVVNVLENSPAQLGGIKLGDIIIEFNGKDLQDKTLATMIQEQEIGSEVSVIVIRDRTEKELTIKIGER
ncbi:MAG TPA: trypsin-like peptidase domain-containing protein [Candidatus Dojkabacteria bacterium]|nr:trypsin-like peptidase domain-containing protein [Candidatus Dojkabacteria bacterium]